MLPGRGTSLAISCTKPDAVCKMGRVPAITMIAKTNKGSVKSRESMYWVAAARPSSENIATANTKAQNPNTTSTSPSKCQIPAWAGRVWAKRSKNLVEKVCKMATANKAAPMSWIVVGVNGFSW